MKSSRQLIAAFFKIAIPLGIIAFLIYSIKPEQWTALSEHPKNYPLLVGALLVALGAVSLSFARWCLLVRCQGIELSVVEAFRLGSICFLLNFVSAGSVGGDLFKAIFLAKRRPGKRVQAVASVFVDRGVGLYGLLLLASAAFFFHGGAVDAAATESDDLQKLKWGSAILVFVATGILATLVFGGRAVDRLVQWGGSFRYVGGLIQKVGPPLRMFHNHPFAFAASVVMSVGVHGMLTISVYLIACSLYPSVPTLAEHFIIVPIGMLASALPLTPAGIGVFEAAIDGLYKLIPVETTTASGTLIALVFEMVKVVLAVFGTVFYWTAGAEVRESLEEAEHGDDSQLVGARQA